MNEQLLSLMKTSRDEREQFFLQGAKLCYLAKPQLQPNLELTEGKLEGIRSRLTELIDESQYVNPLDGKLTSRSKVFAEVEILDALFCTYDISAVFGESIPEDLAHDIKTVLHRLHYSPSGIISWEGLQRLTSEPITQNAHRSVEIFTLKVGSPEYPQQLLHELFVMMLYTNRLRKIIPNFQLAYASLNLQKPLTICGTDNLTGICPCNTNQTVDYLLLEKLNGVTMTEALKTCTLEDFLSWIIQLSLAIEMGCIHFGFTHNNLHTDNVIIRKLDSETSIRYFHQNHLYLLKTSTIAVMTNFELAHVKHKYDGVVNPNDAARSAFVVNHSEHFGPLGFTNVGIYHNETRPFYDLYKVIMWSLKILDKHNNAGKSPSILMKDSEDDNVFLRARKASKFFGFVYERDLKRALDTETKLGFIYSLTISDTERSRSISDFLKSLLSEFPRYNKFRRADSGLLAPSELRLGYLDCTNFCLLDGRSKVINYDQTNQGREEKMGKLDRLRFLGAQGCLERYYGLKKRSEELAKFVGLVCNVDLKSQDKAEIKKQKAECKRFTEEALEADKEFKDFRALLEVGKSEMWQITLEEIHLLRVKIDEMIRINNQQIQTMDITDLSVKELLCQQQETIKGKIVTLVGLLATLNAFNAEFDVGQITPNLSISEIIPI
jgi:hypothetical protein